MANESLIITQNNARMTIIGKSWPDASTDSGGGPWDDTYNGTYSGPIPRTDLPTKIAVTTPPWKTRYYQNDVFNDAGMVVTAYREDDTVWTSEKYPDGTIPFWELIHDFVISKYDEYGYVGYGNKILSVNPPKSIMWSCFFPYRGDPYHAYCTAYLSDGESKSVILGGGTYHYNNRAESEIGKHLFYIPSGDYAWLTFVASTSPYYYCLLSAHAPKFSSYSYAEFVNNLRSKEAEAYAISMAKRTKLSQKDSYTKDGKTVYVSGFSDYPSVAKPSPIKGGSDQYGTWVQAAGWEAIYGNERIIDFPISWARPEDGVILTTSIKITVVGSNNSFV